MDARRLYRSMLRLASRWEVEPAVPNNLRDAAAVVQLKEVLLRKVYYNHFSCEHDLGLSWVPHFIFIHAFLFFFLPFLFYYVIFIYLFVVRCGVVFANMTRKKMCGFADQKRV